MGIMGGPRRPMNKWDHLTLFGAALVFLILSFQFINGLVTFLKIQSGVNP